MDRASPLTPPSIFGVAIASERHWYYFLLPITVVILLLNVNWLRSAFGRAWMAIRHRDIAAESLGINVARYKLLAFSASTSLTCFAGALWAYHTGFVSVEAFDFQMLIQLPRDGDHRRSRLGAGRDSRCGRSSSCCRI